MLRVRCAAGDAAADGGASGGEAAREGGGAPLPGRLPRRGRILLCSDGLHDQVPEPEILRMAQQNDLDQAVSELVCASNQAGGVDNVTVVIVDISVPD